MEICGKETSALLTHTLLSTLHLAKVLTLPPLSAHRLWVNSRPPPAKPTGSGACQCANRQRSVVYRGVTVTLHCTSAIPTRTKTQRYMSNNNQAITSDLFWATFILYVMICICVACLKTFLNVISLNTFTV